MHAIGPANRGLGEGGPGVSLAEAIPQYGDDSVRGLDRTPPQNMTAEQCVLGAMMLSKDAIADVIEALRGSDFYRPAHEQIYDAIVDLYGRGEPADAVTVSAELGKRGELLRIGGAPYLHDLLQSVPLAANAGFYADIVREKAILRRLADASVRIAQMSYAAEGEVDDIVDRAQAEVYAVTERRAAEDYKPLSELMQPTLDEMEAISSRDGSLGGVPTGFSELDELTNGLHPGQMVIVAARPGCGKALALDTPLPTPSGWTTMGEVEVGDRLFGSDGRPTTVVAATEVLTGRPCFEMIFSDGTRVVADGEHLWRATSRAARRAAAERDAALPHAGTDFVEEIVSLTAALERIDDPTYVTLDELVDEYGEVIRRDLLAVAHGIEPAVRALAGAGSREGGDLRVVYRRTQLLRGLVDRWNSPAPSEVITTAELAHSLRAGDGSPNWSIAAARPLQLEDLRVEVMITLHEPGGAFHDIVDVRRVESVPVRCVQVDNADHTYLVQRAMIPTHNSTLALDLARSASIRHSLTSVIFSLEMSQIEITMRLLSAEAQIPLGHIRGGRMSDDDWSRVAAKMGQVSEAPLFIDDSPNLTMMEIRAKARRLKQRHELKLVVIDYIQLMTSG
jgi:replicative DNA helicase